MHAHTTIHTRPKQHSPLRRIACFMLRRCGLRRPFFFLYRQTKHGERNKKTLFRRIKKRKRTRDALCIQDAIRLVVRSARATYTYFRFQRNVQRIDERESEPKKSKWFDAIYPNKNWRETERRTKKNSQVIMIPSLDSHWFEWKCSAIFSFSFLLVWALCGIVNWSSVRPSTWRRLDYYSYE